MDTHFTDSTKPSYSPVSLLSTFVEMFATEQSFVARADEDTDWSYQIPDYLMYTLHINDVQTFVLEFNLMIDIILTEHVVGSFLALYNDYKLHPHRICEQFKCYTQHDKIDTDILICLDDECDHDENCLKDCTLDDFISKRIERWMEKNKSN